MSLDLLKKGHITSFKEFFQLTHKPTTTAKENSPRHCAKFCTKLVLPQDDYERKKILASFDETSNETPFEITTLTTISTLIVMAELTEFEGLDLNYKALIRNFIIKGSIEEVFLSKSKLAQFYEELGFFDYAVYHQKNAHRFALRSPELLVVSSLALGKMLENSLSTIDNAMETYEEALVRSKSDGNSLGAKKVAGRIIHSLLIQGNQVFDYYR